MKTSSLQLPSLAGTLSIKSMLQSAPKHVIFIFKIYYVSSHGTINSFIHSKIQKNFLGRGHSPLSRPLPQREGDTPPAPTPSAPVAPRSSGLRRSLTHPPLGSLATGLSDC